MKPTLSLLLAVFLLPQAGWADRLPVPSFHGMRRVVGGSKFGAAVVPVRYRPEENPQVKDPYASPPPNLRREQVDQVLAGMIALEEKRRGIQNGAPSSGSMLEGLLAMGRRLNLSEEDTDRLIFRLGQLDRTFVDSIPARRWEKVLGEMGRIAEEKLDGSASNWDDVIDQMLKQAVREQKDPNSIFMTPEEYAAYKKKMRGVFSGIGVSLRKEEGRGARVEIVFPGSPAEKAGVRIGDVITEVDGVAVGGRELDEIVRRILGKKNTRVVLGAERKGNALRLAPTRDDFKMANVYSKMVAPGIGYVYFRQFGEGADGEVFREIRRLKAAGMLSLILDVRNNLGGLVPAVSSIASEFLKDGQNIVTFKRQGTWLYRNVTEGDGKFSDIPVAVLVDGKSASASEILAGAIQDHVGRPAVIGSRTYGKGTMQTVSPGGGGRAMKLTTARWYTPADRDIDARHDPETGKRVPETGGVIPDITVDIPEEQRSRILGDILKELNGIAVDSPTPDPQLQKAVEVLGGAGS